METYLIGLLVILIVILIGLVYFMSKQVRENDTKLKINIKDLEALRNKVAEMDALLNAQFHQGEQIHFDGEMFERDEPELMQEGGVDDEEDVVLDDPEYDVDEPEIEDVTEEIVDDVVEEEVVDEVVPEENVEDVVEEEVVEEVVPEETVEDVVEEEVVEEVVPEETVEEEVVPEETVVDVVEEEVVDEVVPEESEGVVSNDVVDDLLEKVLEKPKKKKYKQPSSKAKDYEVGHKMESDNDGETYEVVTDSRNRPRWKRVSE